MQKVWVLEYLHFITIGMHVNDKQQKMVPHLNIYCRTTAIWKGAVWYLLSLEKRISVMKYIYSSWFTT